VPTGTVGITVNVSEVWSGLVSTPDVWLRRYGRSLLPIQLTGMSYNGATYQYTGSYDVTTYTATVRCLLTRVTTNPANKSEWVRMIVYKGIA